MHTRSYSNICFKSRICRGQYGNDRGFNCPGHESLGGRLMFTYDCEITYIVDGDTCDVKIDLGFDVFYKTRVRLHGINAPESRTRDKEEKYRGLQAKSRFTELVREKNVRLISHEKGKYGRVLGEILIERGSEWVNVNKQLVQEGHAVEYFGGKRK